MADIETSRELSRSDVATYLREFADQLDTRGTTHTDNTQPLDDTAGSPETTHPDDTHGKTGTPPDAAGPQSNTGTDADTDTDEAETNHAGTYDKVTVFVGNDSATINPPETMTFEVVVDDDSAMLTSSNRRSVDFHLEWDTDAVDDEGDLHIQ
jgi:hypothetical protein